MSKPEIVAIVGPVALWTKLVAEFDRLTLAGFVVLMPCAARFRQRVTDEQIAALNALHREKIRMSDRVVAVLPSWYKGGDGTREEIQFAASIGRPVTLVTR